MRDNYVAAKRRSKRGKFLDQNSMVMIRGAEHE